MVSFEQTHAKPKRCARNQKHKNGACSSESRISNNRKHDKPWKTKNGPCRSKKCPAYKSRVYRIFHGHGRMGRSG